jgi:predicted pyridoxine 5'-phosphate oxidase superfamily flavin-nucleotide-binding protein
MKLLGQHMLPDDTSFITNEAGLRALHHRPMLRATGKVLPVLDKYCRRIISLSPFCVIATQGPHGADVSPRGDPAGFVRVLDDLTLLLPDRVGNNRLDAMTNLLVNPRMGLLFLVPGMNETLRINGTARITDDARLLEPSAINDRTPKIGYCCHCSGGAPALRQGAGPISALGSEPTYRPSDPAHLRSDAARARQGADP